MAVFKIEIEEILQRVIPIKANSLDDAFQTVHKLYDEQEIILDYNDLVSVETRQYKER